MARVLVIDDEEHVRQAVSFVLQQGGYEVIEAADGEEAIAMIKSYPSGFSAQAIICDIHLPKVNGHDLIAFIRQKLPTTRYRADRVSRCPGSCGTVQARCRGLSHQAGQGRYVVGRNQEGYR
jgi:CheY-like chemotaxis protein